MEKVKIQTNGEKFDLYLELDFSHERAPLELIKEKTFEYLKSSLYYDDKYMGDIYVYLEKETYQKKLIPLMNRSLIHFNQPELKETDEPLTFLIPRNTYIISYY